MYQQALFSIFINAINLARIRRSRPLVPLGFNVLFDVLIAGFTIAYAVRGLGGVLDQYNWGWGKLSVQILTAIVLGMAAMFG